MSKSKSGTIRMAIGPIKKRLEDNVATALTLVNTTIPSDQTATSLLCTKIETASARLSSSITSLSERDSQWAALMVQLDEDEIAAEEELYGKVASSATGYIIILEEAKELINLLNCKLRQVNKSVASQASSGGSSETSVTSKNQNTTVKLPKLELPTFSGDPMEWQQFWTVFEATVHATSLSNVEKFSYLKGQLKSQSDAESAIAGLPITADGYKVAVDTLKTRFYRAPEQLVSNLYGQLKRLPPSTGQGKEMRKTFDSCEKILRQLKDAKEDVESNRSLVLDIWSKYPEQVLKDMTHRKAINAQSTLTQVQSALKDYINEAESLSDMLHDLQPFQRPSPKSGSKDHKPPHNGYVPFNGQTGSYGSQNTWNRNQSNHTPALAVSTGPAARDVRGQVPTSPCYFCDDQHFNSQCNQYKTVVERLSRLSEVNRCQRCLDSTHLAGACRTRSARIRCHFCQTTGEHPSPLCPIKFSSTPHSECQLTTNVRSIDGSKQSKSVTAKQQSSTDSPCVLGVEEQALLATAVTVIRNPETGAERQVRVILDNGCPRTFVLDSVAKELNLRSSPSRNLYISAFGCKRTSTHPSLQIRFDMQLRNGTMMTINANTVNLIVNRSAQPEELPEATQRLIETMGNQMADSRDNEGPPEVLIGSDYFWQLIPCNRETTDDGIHLISSGLGILLGGKYHADNGSLSDYPALVCLTERTSSSNIETSLTSISSVSKSTQQYPDIDEFWKLERIGINDDPVDNDDDIAQAQFDRTVKFENGRYQVCWPWKDNQHLLPTNYNLAVGRLRSLAKRLSRSDGNLVAEYNKIIADQLEQGIIERVPDNEVMSCQNMVHYLPHHPVVRTTNTTTKVRIVYDASSKCRSDQMSLNECLFRGPVLLPDLCSIILRFRLHEIAIVADIEKAFLQMGLQPSQRDVTRFLWFRDSSNLTIDNNLVVYRFLRVLFGAISSPSLLGSTILHHLQKVATPVAIQISKDTYVDNVISGTPSEDAAIEFYDSSKHIFNGANMNLREWSSNSSKLRQHIPPGDHAVKHNVKVLGLVWNSDDDYLMLQNDWSTKEHCRSKRDILQAIASIFDPLGFFQPCTLQAKCCLRELWIDGFGWDDEINDSYLSRWKSIHAEIAPIFQVRIPRKISIPASDPGVCLAIFSDASKDAYGTAVYLRTRDVSNSHQWSSNLVYAKTRLTPKSLLKSISLPRLELLGLTVGTRAADFVRSSVQREQPIKCYMFSDSVCVLSWLRTSKTLQKFVDNRVKEIKTLKNAEYHHVASEDNPADLCTRGLNGDDLAQSVFWWHGPEWLKHDVETWPTNRPIEVITDTDFLKETKGPAVNQSISLLAGEGLPESSSYPFSMEPSKFSSLLKLLRVTAICLKYIKKSWWDRISIEKRESSRCLGKLFGRMSVGNQVTTEDIVISRMIWLTAVQSEEFSAVREALRNNKTHQLITQLNLQLDEDGILRCYGRLALAELPMDAITPILLPKSNALTKLIIEDAHRAVLHNGISYTLSLIRHTFWIPHGRTAVRKVLNQCIVCNRNKGHPFALPPMPPLPRERVSRSRPFQFTGLDYLGPVNVQASDGSTMKMWCCLFTCLTIRAIHLECVTDCTAQTFIECLSRFIARRGCPEKIISDNAPQFRLAKTLIDRTWQTVMSDDVVTSYIANKGIMWKFIVELAPWQGGFYERLVGIVKSTFKSVIGRRLMKWEEFITLIAETEAIVNSRPLTYVHGDIDSGLALRPMDFIVDLPTGTTVVEANIRAQGGDAGKFLLKLWKSKQKRLDAVWNHWYDHYLLSLRERDAIIHKNSRSALQDHPRVGEVVVVRNTDAPRGQWKLARVLSLIPSNDGVVRAVQLKLPNSMVVKRPINHLYRLEMPSTIDENDRVDGTSGMLTDGDDEEFAGFEIAEVEEAERVAEAIFAARHDRSNQLSTITMIDTLQRCIADNLCSEVVNPSL